MADDGLEYSTDMTDLTSKSNRKSLMIGTGSQINAMVNTYPGQKAFCTSTGSGFTANRYYLRDSTNTTWTEKRTQNEPAEASQDYLAFTGTNNIPSGTAVFRQFTFPTTEKFYWITGIEWKNGGTVSGNVICGAFIDDSETTSAVYFYVPMIAWGGEVAQTGTNAVQRVSMIRSKPVPAGTICYYFIQTDNTTGLYNHSAGTGIASTVTYQANPKPVFGLAMSDTGLKYGLKLYYRGEN